MTETIEAIVAYHFKHATAAQVFDAWIEEDQLRAWIAHESLLGSADSDGLIDVEVEAREGGRYRFTERRDGELVHTWGTYRRLERPHLLEFTWFTSEEDEEDGTSIVTVEITEDDQGCTVTLTHSIDAEWAEYLERTEKAWSDMLAAIDSSLA